MKNIYIYLSSLFLAFVLSFTIVSTAHAQADPIYADEACRGRAVGECVDNYTCVISGYDQISETERAPVITRSTEPNCNDSEIGAVRPPVSIVDFNDRVVGGAQGEEIGLIVFISNLIKVFAIITGIWAMFNLIMGGYTFITSMSDAGAMEKVKNSMTMTVIGLAIIAGAYIIAALIGALMFGDPSFILQPKLEGALQGTTP